MFETIIREVQQDGMTFDVRCYLLPHATGVLLIDTGLPGTVESIGEGLERLGANWGDVTDIVLTHKHFDHVAGLAEVVGRVGAPAVWAGTEAWPTSPSTAGSTRSRKAIECAAFG